MTYIWCTMALHDYTLQLPCSLFFFEVLCFYYRLLRLSYYLWLAVLFSIIFNNASSLLYSFLYCFSCVTWAEGPLETTSLPSEGRGKTAYTLRSPDPTCGTTLILMLYGVQTSCQTFFFHFWEIRVWLDILGNCVAAVTGGWGKIRRTST